MVGRMKRRVVLVLLAFFLPLVFAATPLVWHPAEQIKPGVLGGDFGGGDFSVNGSFIIVKNGSNAPLVVGPGSVFSSSYNGLYSGGLLPLWLGEDLLAFRKPLLVERWNASLGVWENVTDRWPWWRLTDRVDNLVMTDDPVGVVKYRFTFDLGRPTHVNGFFVLRNNYGLDRVYEVLLEASNESNFSSDDVVLLNWSGNVWTNRQYLYAATGGGVGNVWRRYVRVTLNVSSELSIPVYWGEMFWLRAGGQGDDFAPVNRFLTPWSWNEFLALRSRFRGDASMPAVSFSDDNNTGLFNPSQNVFAVSTGGVERLRVDGNGRVGIGTVNPAYSLDVSSSGTPLALRTSNDTNVDMMTWFHPNTSVRWHIDSGDHLELGISRSGQSTLWNVMDVNPDTGDVYFGYRVGIGTVSPSHSLDVYSDSASVWGLGNVSGRRGSLLVSRKGDNDFVGLGLYDRDGDYSTFDDLDSVLFWGDNEGSDNLRFSLVKWNGSEHVLVDRMILTSSGRLGVGVSSPLGLLHVLASSGDAELFLEADPDDLNEDDNPRIVFVHDGRRGNLSVGFLDGFNSGNTFGFRFVDDTGADRMILSMVTGNGYVGIGSSSPSEALYVVGNGYFTGTVTQNSDVRVKVNVSGVGGSVLGGLVGLEPIVFSLDYNKRELLWGWRVLVDSWDSLNSSVRSRVLGCLGGRSLGGVVNVSFVDWGVVRCVLSDPLVSGFLGSRGVRVGDALAGRLGVAGPFVGFRAQDVLRVFPLAVRRDPSTGLLSVSYSGLVPLVVRGLGELDRRVRRLESSSGWGGNVSVALFAVNASRSAVADYAKNASYAYRALSADSLEGYRLEDITRLIDYGLEPFLRDVAVNESTALSVRWVGDGLNVTLTSLVGNTSLALPPLRLDTPPVRVKASLAGGVRIILFSRNETLLYTLVDGNWSQRSLP